VSELEMPAEGPRVIGAVAISSPRRTPCGG
jgi:hypothetical protein